MIPTCQRCSTPLPGGPDPLRRRYSPEEARRFTGDHQPPRPVKVSRPGADGQQVLVGYYCSSRCFKRMFAKPAKTRKGKPGRHQQLNLKPSAA